MCGGNADQPQCAPHAGIIKPLLQLNAAVAAITESDLGIYKDCKPDGDKLLGEEALCFLTVTNYGDDAAMNVAVTDTYISDGSADFDLVPPATILVSIPYTVSFVFESRRLVNRDQILWGIQDA